MEEQLEGSSVEKVDTCVRCGWKYGFHICVDLSKPCKGEAKVSKRFPRVMRRFDSAHGDFNSWSDGYSRPEPVK